MLFDVFAGSSEKRQKLSQSNRDDVSNAIIRIANSLSSDQQQSAPPRDKVDSILHAMGLQLRRIPYKE